MAGNIFQQNMDNLIALIYSKNSFTEKEIVQEFFERYGNVPLDGMTTIPDVIKDMHRFGSLRRERGHYIHAKSLRL